MKKFTAGILALLFVLILTGCCENYSYEETKIETTVIRCEEENYHPNSSYLATANMYLAQKNYGLWSMYTNLANSTGSYDYNITVNIDGADYVVVRSKKYEVGQTIVVTRVDSYDENSTLVKTEYK